MLVSIPSKYCIKCAVVEFKDQTVIIQITRGGTQNAAGCTLSLRHIFRRFSFGNLLCGWPDEGESSGTNSNTFALRDKFDGNFFIADNFLQLSVGLRRIVYVTAHEIIHRIPLEDRYESKKMIFLRVSHEHHVYMSVPKWHVFAKAIKYLVIGSTVNDHVASIRKSD